LRLYQRLGMHPVQLEGHGDIQGRSSFLGATEEHGIRG
jgi:hypothetical protein